MAREIGVNDPGLGLVQRRPARRDDAELPGRARVEPAVGGAAASSAAAEVSAG